MVKKLLFVDQIYMAGNPFQCNCEMTWMIEWLRASNSTTKGVVVDLKNVKCHSGPLIGKAIYTLKEVDMGCFPHKLSTMQKFAISFGAILAILLILAAIFVTKKSKDLKFLLHYYVHLDMIPKDEKDEVIANKEYDAFFCYW